MQKTSEEKIRENALDIVKNLLKEEVAELAADICLYDSEEYANGIPKEIEDIRAGITEAVVSLEDTLKKDIDDRNNEIDKLGELKRKLIEIGKTLYSYYSSADLFFLILQNKVLEARVRAEKEQADIDKSILTEACVKYIDNAENKYDEMRRKAKVLSCLPVKMTSAEYAEHIKKPIKYLLEVLPHTAAQYVCNKLKSDFAPFITEEFGKVYPEFADRINSLLEKQLFSLDYAEYQKVLDELRDISNESEDIIYDFNMYYNDINYLLNIFSFAVDAEYLVEDDFELKDIFYSLKNFADKEEKELISETISEKVDDKIEEITEKLTELTKVGRRLTNFISKKNAEKMAESTKICLTTLNITYLNHTAELIDVYSDEFSERTGETPCSKEEIEKLSSELCDYIGECRKKVSVPMYRELKRVFLNKLPCMLGNADFMYSVQETISEINDMTKLCAVAAVLMGEFSQDKDFPEDNAPDEENERKSLSFSEKI